MERRVLLVSEINFLLLLLLALNIEISTYKSDLKVNSIESNRCFIETPINRSRNSRTSTTKKCKWLKSRPLYYHNSTASFNVTASAILICGDVHPHPGPVLDTSSSNPKPKSGFTAKCLKCSKPVQRNHKHLQCDKCYDLIHVRCVSSNASFHKTINVNQPGIWTCSSCILSELPFFKVKDLVALNTTDDAVSDLHWNSDRHLDAVIERQKQLSFMHINMQCMTSTFDELLLVIQRYGFDVVMLSET